MLQESLATLSREKYFILAAGLAARLAEGLAVMGRFDEARETIKAMMDLCEARGDVFDIADHLRIRGEIALAEPS